MKMIFTAAALMMLTGTALAQTPTRTAAPAEWAMVSVSANINKPADAAWKGIGGDSFCSISKFLAVKSCVVNKGKGEVGSIRTINGNIVELVVAHTAHSFTYAQPFGTNFFHGTEAVEAVDATHSKVVYTMIWNEAPLGTAKAKAAARASRHTRFQDVVNKMAAAASAAP